MCKSFITHKIVEEWIMDYSFGFLSSSCTRTIFCFFSQISGDQPIFRGIDCTKIICEGIVTNWLTTNLNQFN